MWLQARALAEFDPKASEVGALPLPCWMSGGPLFSPLSSQPHQHGPPSAWAARRSPYKPAGVPPRQVALGGSLRLKAVRYGGEDGTDLRLALGLDVVPDGEGRLQKVRTG
jgi:hypothetical protein